MSTTQATAQVFLTAFKALPPRTRDQVLSGLIHDKKLREDLLDLAIVESRMKEPSRPLRTFLAELKSKELS